MESSLIETIFKATFIQSLEDLALIAYAINMFENCKEVFNSENNEYDWGERCMSEVLKKIPNNSLPTLIKEKISSVIRYVGESFLKWLKSSIFYHPKVILVNFELPKKSKQVPKLTKEFIKWTNYGTVDEDKTWEAIATQMTPEAEDISTYFEKSCKFCNETLIQKFWNQMSEDKQKCYARNYDCFLMFDYLKKYWASIYDGSSDLFFSSVVSRRWRYMCRNLEPFMYGNGTKTLNELMFLLAVIETDFSAVKYFWNKLNLADLSFNAVNFTKTLAMEMFCKDCLNHEKSDVIVKIVWFLLKNMSSDEALDVLKECSSYILRAFHVHLPVHTFFLDLWSIGSQFITPLEYLEVVNEILIAIQKKKATMSVFKGLWRHTSLTMRKSFLGLLISEENQLKNLKCQVRFCEAVVLDTMEVLFHDDELKTFKPDTNFTSELLIENEKFDVLDFWLNATSSNSSEFKRKFFTMRGLAVFSYFLHKKDFDNINLFLDWVFKSCDQTGKNELRKVVIKDMAFEFSRVCLKLNKFQQLEKFLNYLKSESEDFVLIKQEPKIWIKFLELIFPNKFDNFDKIFLLKRAVMSEFEYENILKNWHEVKIFLDWGRKKTVDTGKIIMFKNYIINLLGSEFFRHVVNEERYDDLDEIMSWFFCDHRNYAWKCHDYKIRMVEKCGFRTFPASADECCHYDDDEDDYFTYKYEFFKWFFKDNVHIPDWYDFKESVIEDEYCIDICSHTIGRGEPEIYRLILIWGFSHLIRENDFQNKLNVFKRRVMERVSQKYISSDSWQQSIREFLQWGVNTQEEMENLKLMIYSKPFVMDCHDELGAILSNWNFGLSTPMLANEIGIIVISDEEEEEDEDEDEDDSECNSDEDSEDNSDEEDDD